MAGRIGPEIDFGFLQIGHELQYLNIYAIGRKIKEGHREISPVFRNSGNGIDRREWKNRAIERTEAARASQALYKKHSLGHGIFVPITHRLRGYKAMHIELTPEVG